MSINLSQLQGWSLYLTQQLARHPEWSEPSGWSQCNEPGSLLAKGKAWLLESKSLDELNQRLRTYRNQQMVRIAIRDLAGLAELSETLQETSDLADCLVGGALDWHYRLMIEKFGTPIGKESGLPQQMLVLGMGKLGGQELNFSSDIDMIYVYPERGNTQGGRTQMDNEQFFIRLAQAMNKSLADYSADGFVYRVDMRLRPFGTQGPLAVSFSGMENYYALHGRAWERYALVKARLMAGDVEQGKELFDILRPFVYRKYVDFTALDSLRDLKMQIEAQVVKKGMQDNLKLGPGGIREIEFIVQAFQLIHGGRMPQLQGRSLLPMLQAVQEAGFLTPQVTDALRQAYLFLRRAENRIQIWSDQQAHSLPTDAEQLNHLANAMGFAKTTDFMAELNAHRAQVQVQFDAVFAIEELKQPDENAALSKTWKVAVEDDAAYQMHGFKEPAEMARLLDQFKKSPKVQKLPVEGLERLDKVMPLVLQALHDLPEHQAQALDRTLRVLESVLRRSVYLVLLIENPQVLRNLIKVCALSPWMTEMLSKYPSLLDQLLDEQNVRNLMNREQLMADAQALQQKFAGDDEAFMNGLRQWRHTQVFKVAMADETGHLPIMQVSDALTWIAEAVLQAVVDYAYHFMRQKSGIPGGMSTEDELPFLILGYGKLGGIELGYGSDLDMVFLYDGLENSASSSGARSLENNIYFMRLGQKVISLLTTMMPTGMLYEVDTRLRPNGESGLIVTDFKSYQAYIENKAWVWEHQALVRARAVIGSSLAKQHFEEFRLGFMQKTRDENTIRQEVRDMRQKMRKSLDKTNAEQFDLKQGLGGIVDIEFMVQFFILSYAAQYPSLAVYSDNIRLLGAIAEAQLLTAEDAADLEDIYREYRAFYHHLALQNIKSLTPIDTFEKQRQRVAEIWQKVMLVG
ncbi:bifunctional [glutamate--ammonia ligase]-adenylyl-L-tyrosine phosphorylase/[glutamate--ammonia-ligase] adenylyltransferase [Thiosulfativibrio zosterae]|uniref:Bifunctional glutamine synthetase adenylyltransferase/adenylyl-removing enzyme n=1 Tax=Thiosulfativibrio zosterae TaxID=2675053 RepID=A0A6F8PPP0_9GAMM|nr:bifunctional [glutamate--ammonia ligase]-adenylyl-L-tyrosine phosphorylase/[glutamate--ammonia-ligase] adenylyltransferase [Thiosulfativibrio zosterae]BBP44046.1 glutamate-ammonia-ligase adenylyltransferase [Thiosulfativibrio zosterae]